MNNVRQATLCFLIRPRSKTSSLQDKENAGDRELLLAFKKKGFGQGKWNGVGGKFDFERDKDIFEAVIRETEEEIGVKIKEPEKLAILNFSYPYLLNSLEREWQTHVFFVKKWQGKPIESEEMRPKWFKINEIPFNAMWPDDKFWLPKVLAGEKVRADFLFQEGEIITSYDIKNVNDFD